MMITGMKHLLGLLTHLLLFTCYTTAALAQSPPAPAEADAMASATLITASATQSSVTPTTATKRVYIIPVQGEFENALHLIMVRAMRQAEREGADAVILDMNTPGGRVDSAIKIRDLLIGSKIPTYTYVNPMAISAGSFIAIATDKIVMGPNSSIGGALPITMAPEGAAAADRKFISIFAAEMRKTAKTKGHREDIAEGFSNPDLVIPGLKEKGDILTLDYDQATSYGLAAFSAASMDELLAHEGFAGAQVERFSPTRTDRVARFLSSSVVMGLLLTIGIGGIFLELKTPGFGLPGAVGISAMLLYFAGSYLANLSGFMEWIFFVLGVGLLIVEIYILPGFGLAGISGIALIVGSLFFGLVNFAPDGGFNLGGVRLQMLKVPALTVIAGLLGVIPALILLARLFPSLPGYGVLVLAPGGGPVGRNGASDRAAAQVATHMGSHHTPQAGARGLAISALRPSGTAEFDGHRTDVVTEGDWIEAGSEIVVLRVEGAKVTVGAANGN